MSPISFFVPGHPKGQPRARAFAMKRGGQTMVRMYDPGTAESWKGQIALASKGMFAKPIDGPVSVTISLFFPRPKNHLRCNEEIKPTAPRYHTTKPDCDNAAKAILDALTTLQAWKDDKQVSHLDVVKQYECGRPGAWITIKPLDALAVAQQKDLLPE